MKLIVGLGNPGEKFVNTRHNVGFDVVDAFIRRLTQTPRVEKKLDSEIFVGQKERIALAKPQTFMNNSGTSVKKITIQYKIKTADLWVIHDDLDLRLGAYKIQKGVGPKLHYGVSSIEENLGSSDFWRVRVGVDNRKNGEKIQGEEYVLRKFSDEETLAVTEVIDQIIPELFSRIIKK